LGFEAYPCRGPSFSHGVDEDENGDEMAKVAEEAKDVHVGSEMDCSTVRGLRLPVRFCRVAIA